MQRLSVRQACTKTCLPFSFFFSSLSLVLTVHFRRWRGKRRARNRRLNKTSTKPGGLTHLCCSSCMGKAFLCQSADREVNHRCPHLWYSGVVLSGIWLLKLQSGKLDLHLSTQSRKGTATALNNQSECEYATVQALIVHLSLWLKLWELSVCKLSSPYMVQIKSSLWWPFLILCVASQLSQREMCIN